jgi:molybdate transport system permease protein
MHRVGLGRILALIAAAAFAVFLILPLIALVLRSIDHIGALDDREVEIVRQAIALSARTSLISLVVIILLGTPLAYVMARNSFRGKIVLETVIDLPMILPPAVAGLALLMAFGRRGLLGEHLNAWGFQIGFSTTAVIIAQIFVASPFYIRAATAAFGGIARAQEEAAADLGANPRHVFTSITVPLAAPGIGAGAVLAWARAVGEFGATIMFAGNLPGVTQTLPLAIYGRFEAGDLNSSLIMAGILLMTSFLVLVSVRVIGGRVRVPIAQQ